MTTRISCKIESHYLKDHDGQGPTVCAVMSPSVWDLLRMLLQKLLGGATVFYYPMPTHEVEEFYNTIKHWYIVKHLRGYKHHAK